MAPRRTHRSAITDVVIYTRISRDKEGEELGVQRQEQACRERAQREGWKVTRVYTDNDISASTRSSKRRPAFEEMMAAAEHGDTQCVLAYSNSRLTRRMSELLRLIELHKTTGVEFRTVVSGDDDLSKAEGIMVAQIKASVDEAESNKISERVSAAVRQRAEQGRFHGGRAAFGYQLKKETIGDRSRVVAWLHHPVHAAWVREAARRVLAGESLYGICNDWNAQGRLTANEVGWRSRSLKLALTSPAVAGYRDLGGGELVKAVWKPILRDDDWRRLRALLGDDMHRPRPFSTGQTAAKHALSGLVLCGLCGCKLTAMPDSKAGVSAFICNKQAHPGGIDPTTKRPRPAACGKVRIAMPPLERWVVDQFLDYIDSDPLERALSAAPDDDLDDQLADVRTAIEADQERLQRLDDERTDGDWDAARWHRQVRRLTQRISDNRALLQQREGQRAQRDGREGMDAAAVVKGWARHDSGSREDNAWRRTVLSMFIEQVVISPFPEGMATTLTKRKTETDDEFAERRDAHRADVLDQRVKVRWRA